MEELDAVFLALGVFGWRESIHTCHIIAIENDLALGAEVLCAWSPLKVECGEWVSVVAGTVNLLLSKEDLL